MSPGNCSGGSARCWPPGPIKPGSIVPQFTPLYVDALVPQWPIEGLGWRADELVLDKGLIGQHGRVPLARWSLRA